MLVAVVVPKPAFTSKYPDLGSKEAQQAMLAVRTLLSAVCGLFQWGAACLASKEAQRAMRAATGPVVAWFIAPPHQRRQSSRAYQLLPASKDSPAQAVLPQELSATQKAKKLKGFEGIKGVHLFEEHFT